MKIRCINDDRGNHPRLVYNKIYESTGAVVDDDNDEVYLIPELGNNRSTLKGKTIPGYLKHRFVAVVVEEHQFLETI